MNFPELSSTGMDDGAGKNPMVLMVIHAPESMVHHSELFRALGYEVLACDSCGGGLEMLRDEAFNFVTVGPGRAAFEGKECGMPSDRADPSVPVLVLAREAETESLGEATPLGVADDLELPVLEEDFLRVLRTHLLRSIGRGYDA